MPIAFLSHSSIDKSLAQRIALDLSMSGIPVWFYEWEIQVGHSISQRIEEGLDNADFVIVLLTINSVSSEWVQKEWRSVIGDEASSHGVRILPVRADDCEIPRLMKDKRYADLRGSYDHGIQDLISAIRSHRAGQRPVSGGAQISSGRVVTDYVVPDDPKFRHIKGMIITVESGCFERCEAGLKAHIQLVYSHQPLQELAEEMGINRVTLESGDYSISTDPASPSKFSLTQVLDFPARKVMLDITTGNLVPLPFALNVTVETKVSGIAKDGLIVGRFDQSVVYKIPIAPPFSMGFSGSFSATIAL
jgi:hypothetical protein